MSMTIERPLIEGAHTTYVPSGNNDGRYYDHSMVISLEVNDGEHTYDVGGSKVVVDPLTAIATIVVPEGQVVRASIPRAKSLIEETLDLAPNGETIRLEMPVDLATLGRLTVTTRTGGQMPESVWLQYNQRSLVSSEAV